VVVPLCCSNPNPPQALLELKTLDLTQKIVPQLLGTVPADAARIVIDAFKLPLTPTQYLEERNARTDSLFPQVRAHAVSPRPPTSLSPGS
jgi:hypothetical protein